VDLLDDILDGLLLCEPSSPDKSEPGPCSQGILITGFVLNIKAGFHFGFLVNGTGRK
jgi:hypothetical protein